MNITQLEKTLKVLKGQFKDYKYGEHFDFEYEDEETYDQYQIDIKFNFGKGKFELAYSCYHAGDDNNAENPDGHTEEEIMYFNSLKELFDSLDERCQKEFNKELERWH